jgi:lipoprotein-anchoring transpeptidase ErfK/SrfK
LRHRGTLLAVLSAFFVMASAAATLADAPGGAYRPVTIDVGAADAVPAQGIARPAPAQLLPFEAPGVAYAGMGKDARAAARPAPEDSGEGRRVVYAVRAQRVWLVEADGTVFDTYLVSGRRNTPRPGTYKVFSKSRNARATHGGITMKYMVRFTRASSGVPIGFHDLPRYSNGRPMQTPKQLGTYQSGGCVRQTRAHAIQLFEWAPIGTKVVVLK